MIDRDSFVLGENVKIKVYKVDEYSGEYSYKEVEGKVIQITDSFVVLQKKHTKESFRYSELNLVNDIQPEKNPYDEEGINYAEDIVVDCLNHLNKGKQGYVFNDNQLSEVVKRTKRELKVSYNHGIYEIS